MNLADLKGKIVKRGMDPFDEDNDNELYVIEFIDGTSVTFGPDSCSPYSIVYEYKRKGGAVPEDSKLPSLRKQAWNLIQALDDFVADGLRTVTEVQYQVRLETCDDCDRRRGNRCIECGCRLSLKARGRVFKCPLGKWPMVETKETKLVRKRE